jgi:hypothetical protein
MISSWLGTSAVGWLAPVVPTEGAMPLSVVFGVFVAGMLIGVFVSGIPAC